MSPIRTVMMSSPPIVEVTEDSSNEAAYDHRRSTEYSSLLPRGGNLRKHSIKKYKACEENSETSESSEDGDFASDEISSNSSSLTSGWTSRQLLVFCQIMVTTCSSSFTVCLFPPFFPALAESKGVQATGYGMIIGTNCLVAFIVTPFIGNHLNIIGVKFAYCAGLFGGGICCVLSGMLEFFQPGPLFLVLAVFIRICHAISNAFVITSSFTYTACEFPTAMARIFSLTRTAMNVAQMCGPWLGGMMFEIDGFYVPFTVMGLVQVTIALECILFMPRPDTLDDDMDDDTQTKARKKKAKASVLKILKIPTVWFSFLSFIVATMCNGFLSVNLEPKVIRNFNLSASNVGLLYGLRDGANSLASPVWGYLCDRKKSVKPYLVIGALFVATSFFLLKAFEVLGIKFELTIYLLVLALCINGMGIGGQQIVGVVDALHEAVGAGYPDDASTQGLIAGLWSSLSGMGRFISRAGSGCLVDNFGFSVVSAIFCSLQLFLAVATFLYLILFECHLKKRNYSRWDDVTVVEHGRRRDERIVFNANCSPSDSIMTRSVFIGIPHLSSGARIANSMPPKVLKIDGQRNRSRSVR